MNCMRCEIFIYPHTIQFTTLTAINGIYYKIWIFKQLLALKYVYILVECIGYTINDELSIYSCSHFSYAKVLEYLLYKMYVEN